MKPRRTFHAAKAPTRRQKRGALFTLLVMCENLDGLDVASLARSYGMSVADVEAAVLDERLRRVRG